MPIVFLAATEALSRLPRVAARLPAGNLAARLAVPVALGVMVLAGIGFTIAGPYPRMLSPAWWQSTPYAMDASVAVTTVPAGATVAAHNRLAVHLVTDREVHLLDAGLRDAYGRIIDVEYVVAETTGGYFPISPAERRRLLADLQNCGYQKIYAHRGFVTLRRTATAPRGAELAACLPQPPGRSAGR